MLENITIIFLLLVTLDYLFFGKITITYQLTVNELRVILFKLFLLHAVPINIIEKVEKITYSRMFFGMATYINAFRSRAFGDGVLITTNAKYGNEIVITPHNADEFITKIVKQLNVKKL